MSVSGNRNKPIDSSHTEIGSGRPLSGGVYQTKPLLVSMMLVAVVALMASIPNQFAVDSISRDLRLIGFTAVRCFSFGWGGSDFIRLGSHLTRLCIASDSSWVPSWQTRRDLSIDFAIENAFGRLKSLPGVAVVA